MKKLIGGPGSNHLVSRHRGSWNDYVPHYFSLCKQLPRFQAFANFTARTLVEARHGYVLYNVNDRYTGRSVEHYGQWSPGGDRAVRPVLPEGHYVVDVGANIGTPTLAFARLVGERGRVFAFEPQRMMAQVLAANVALNSLANVHTHHLGVGAEDGALWLADIDYSREANFGGVSLDAVGPARGRPAAEVPGRSGAAG